jgi:hypothetical protein
MLVPSGRDCTCAKAKPARSPPPAPRLLRIVTNSRSPTRPRHPLVEAANRPAGRQKQGYRQGVLPAAANGSGS